jgi:DNA repair exonuclease SbcCD ATPase subunit
MTEADRILQRQRDEQKRIREQQIRENREEAARRKAEKAAQQKQDREAREAAREARRAEKAARKLRDQNNPRERVTAETAEARLTLRAARARQLHTLLSPRARTPPTHRRTLLRPIQPLQHLFPSMRARSL